MLISEPYREANRNLIENDPTYAISGHLARGKVRELADWGRKPVLDYGCGRKLLQQALGPAYEVHNYDPAVPDCAADPAPCETVYCGDVLEHVEPDCLDDVLADLRRVTIGKGYFRICLCQSTKTLPDGRNAHLIIEGHEWWKDKLSKAGFVIGQEKPAGGINQMTWFVVT